MKIIFVRNTVGSEKWKMGLFTHFVTYADHRSGRDGLQLEIFAIWKIVSVVLWTWPNKRVPTTWTWKTKPRRDDFDEEETA